MKLETPNVIEVLLHCHVCPEPHPRWEAPAVQEALRFLAREGAIHSVEVRTYITTDLGAAWVKALCNVEKPRLVYVDTNGNPLTD